MSSHCFFLGCCNNRPFDLACTDPQASGSSGRHCGLSTAWERRSSSTQEGCFKRVTCVTYSKTHGFSHTAPCRVTVAKPHNEKAFLVFATNATNAPPELASLIPAAKCLSKPNSCASEKDSSGKRKVSDSQRSTSHDHQGCLDGNITDFIGWKREGETWRAPSR